jgi:hypothetical protein
MDFIYNLFRSAPIATVIPDPTVVAEVAPPPTEANVLQEIVMIPPSVSIETEQQSNAVEIPILVREDTSALKHISSSGLLLPAPETSEVEPPTETIAESRAIVEPTIQSIADAEPIVTVEVPIIQEVEPNGHEAELKRAIEESIAIVEVPSGEFKSAANDMGLTWPGAEDWAATASTAPKDKPVPVWAPEPEAFGCFVREIETKRVSEEMKQMQAADIVPVQVGRFARCMKSIEERPTARKEEEVPECTVAKFLGGEATPRVRSAIRRLFETKPPRYSLTAESRGTYSLVAIRPEPVIDADTLAAEITQMRIKLSALKQENETLVRNARHHQMMLAQLKEKYEKRGARFASVRTTMDRALLTQQVSVRQSRADLRKQTKIHRAQCRDVRTQARRPPSADD